MSSSGESAEISYCASLLAKAVKDGGTSFSDVHDALGKLLSQSQLSKVEELARKYADLPVHVLERKIKWLESHGEKPEGLDRCLNEVAASKLFETTLSKKSDLTFNEPNNNEYGRKTWKPLTTTTSSSGKSKLTNLKSSLRSSSNNVCIKVSDTIESSVVTHTNVSKILGSIDENELGRDKSGISKQFIEMKELNSQDKVENIGESSQLKKGTDDDDNLQEKPQAASNKKKKNKKKKKTKSTLQTSTESPLPVAVEESVTPSEDNPAIISSKSSRSARRRKLCKSRKELENQANCNDETKNNKDNNEPELCKTAGAKQVVKPKEKMRKRSKTDLAASRINASTNSPSESHVERSKSEIQSEENLMFELESILTSSIKIDSKKRAIQPNFESNSEKISRTPWHVVGSRKSNSQNVHSEGFSKTPMSCPSKTTLMLDSAGGSIASSSEDNSSTSSSGVIEPGVDVSASSRTPNVFSPTEGSNPLCVCEEKNDETSDIYRNNNIMHFGTRWGFDLSNYPTTGEQEVIDLQQTDIENLLHNDLGLDFFNNHLEEHGLSNSEVDSHEPNNFDNGSYNFECGLSSPPNLQSELTLTIVEDVRERLSDEECDSLPVQNQEGRFLKEKSTFDYDGAVQFLWKEWNRVSDKAKK
ncbi:uncharacterized protein LOC144425628 [Styela clava]